MSESHVLKRNDESGPEFHRKKYSKWTSSDVTIQVHDKADRFDSEKLEVSIVEVED